MKPDLARATRQHGCKFCLRASSCCGDGDETGNWRSGMKAQSVARTGAALGLALVVASLALADAPPGRYFNGCEQNTCVWFNFQGGSITMRSSGYIYGG